MKNIVVKYKYYYKPQSNCGIGQLCLDTDGGTL